VPQDWLGANIVPIYKRKGNSSDPASYRPISLTSTSSKVLETIVKSSVMQYLNAENLLHPAQHGFRSKKSTLTNLLSCLHGWHQAADVGDVIHSVYLDFAKAFDTVPHPKLLQKLSAYGIRGHLLGWLKGFLLSRTQRVCVDGEHSESSCVLSGVPQGTVLGPLLFLLYINDMPEMVHDDGISLFADDSKLYVRTSKDTITDARLAESLRKINEWTKTWQLYIPFDSKMFYFLFWKIKCTTYLCCRWNFIAMCRKRYRPGCTPIKVYKKLGKL
jgi:hypothetical protein